MSVLELQKSTKKNKDICPAYLFEIVASVPEISVLPCAQVTIGEHQFLEAGSLIRLYIYVRFAVYFFIYI